MLNCKPFKQTIYTNPSLRATSVSRLFAKNVPEKIIQEKSGRKSLASLRAYEHTTIDQHRAVSKMIDNQHGSFGEESFNPGQAATSLMMMASLMQTRKVTRKIYYQ